MIGQERLKTHIAELIEKDSFPRFLILDGLKGSGKKTLVDEICDQLREKGLTRYNLEDVKVDSIRQMIDNAYRMHNMIYTICDADDMSLAAKNALLKVVEECPNDNYFIMTIQDLTAILDTIRSRASIFHMDTYTVREIEEFVGESDDIDIIKSVCETPGDAQLLIESGARDFYEYVEKVIDHIAEVSGAHSFKIADKVGLKDEEDKYDLKLFWRMFSKVCVDNAIKCFENREDQQGILYMQGAKVTSRLSKGLRVKGLNKIMLFDIWLLEIRREWRL